MSTQKAAAGPSKTETVTKSQEHLLLQKRAPVKETRRWDYHPTNYLVRNVDMKVSLDKDETFVETTLTMSYRDIPCGSVAKADLRLDGERLELVSISCDGKELSTEKNGFRFGGDEDPDCIIVCKQSIPDLKTVDDTFQIRTVVKNWPISNLELAGLYNSRGILVTQCEPHGFRRITYFLDRPDVMATYNVRLEGDKSLYPVLLSNGNEVEKGDLKDGKHFVVFNDPFPKPSYLFALVAGNLKFIEDNFITMETKDQPSRKVRLFAWSEEQYMKRLGYALSALKYAMAWDQERYGRIYDLDIFHLVGISDFNMGAMENKGLNIFNVSCVLASPTTSTDSEFLTVFGVVVHEYFHNWTGNRITCRSWFELTLKEGLTVFRDQTCSQSFGSSVVKRIDDIVGLRAIQFAEDAGPTSHPIRPEAYISMDNFYTSTVYEKGAEVIRMYQTLLSVEGFRAGMDLYFQRHDGNAVTCDDFRAAMSDANGVNLDQFENWYLQKGTPELVVDEFKWVKETKTFKISVSQHLPPHTTTNTAEIPKPYHIPIRFGLIGRESHKDLVKEMILELKEMSQEFEIQNVDEDCVPSFLRDFSAPVKVRPFLSYDDLALLSSYDSDPVTKWDSFQVFSTKILLERACLIRDQNVSVEQLDPLPESLYNVYEATLAKSFDVEDMSLIVYTLSLPFISVLKNLMRPIDPVALHQAREFTRLEIANRFRSTLLNIYNKITAEIDSSYEGKDVEYPLSVSWIGKRDMRNFCLSYICKASDSSAIQEGAELAWAQFSKTNFMNDKLLSLTSLINVDHPHREKSIESFLDYCKGDDLMIDNWFRAQGRAFGDDAFEKIEKLLHNPKYKSSTNPNRISSVLGTFAANLPVFHRVGGKGYEIFASEVLRIDKFNTQLAARLSKRLIDFALYDHHRQALMKKAIERIMAEPTLSPGVYENLSRALKQ